MADDLTLSNLSPAQARTDRKRVGRGQGSGKGRYSGRGLKGQKSRSGSAKMRPGFEGGQMPLYMRVGKQRGATSKDAMPIGPFRTYSQPVNVAALNRFDDGAEVTPESLAAAGLVSSTRKDVKILGNGDLSKKLSVTAHRFSASAREKIEAAGGTATALREPGPAKRRKGRSKRKETPEDAAAETTAAAEERTDAPDPAVDDEAAES